MLHMGVSTGKEALITFFVFLSGWAESPSGVGQRLLGWGQQPMLLDLCIK